MSNENIINIRDLHFSRVSRKIFAGVDMDIQKGKITAIMGPSGTGKTTLLKLIGGQLKPDQGKIYFRDQNIPDLSVKKLYEIRKQMGMLFQSGALLTDMTVFENVAFPLREHTNLPQSMIYALVLLKLQTVGLRGAKDLKPSQLSGGMARRAALARAMVLDPEVIMYDEPFAGQDPISMGVLLKLIKQVNHLLGITSIIVSHDVHETLAIADMIYVLSEGKVVGKGTPDEMTNSSSEWVKQFIHGQDDGPVPFHYPAKDMLDDLLDFS
jgi:phospholipid/cholesterol/gamma-HCH transport system ATP-binding protein